MVNKELIKRHIKTHTENESIDRTTIAVLTEFLDTRDGKINPNFTANDKWPNTDGVFDFIPEPAISRRPEQEFDVQIKGTSINEFDDNGNFKYSLKSLAFPASIACGWIYNPGILFVVLNPKKRGERRVFWKYMSLDYVYSIDYSKDSTTITFKPEDEIEDSEEGVNEFCKKLVEIMETHKFVSRLDDVVYEKKEILKLIEICDEEITKCIEENVSDDTRDNLSRKLLTKMDDFCAAVLLLNAIEDRHKEVNIPLAWEKALFSIKTKYLADFYRGVKYKAKHPLEDGQSERLMLKYYDFLWAIKEFLKNEYNINVLHNLNKFPIEIDEMDEEYNRIVADAIEKAEKKKRKPKSARYSIQKKTPFYVDGKRYFEITLQLENIYASKFNRFTVYSIIDIPTNYPIEIAYSELDISLWNVSTKIKLITDWKVSIAPKRLNDLAKILEIKIKITSIHGEYEGLMNFLTKTGMSLLSFIDVNEGEFIKNLDKIYKDKNTNNFRQVLKKLQKFYSKNKKVKGKNIVRYALLSLDERVLKNILPDNTHSVDFLNFSNVKIARSCYPFEKNPYMSNLAGKRTNESSILNLSEVTSGEKLNLYEPYFKIKNLIEKTGEIYFDVSLVGTEEEIEQLNSQLDTWEIREGYDIKVENGIAYISSYEKATINILKKLIEISKNPNMDREEKNKKFFKSCTEELDEIKRKTIKNAFLDSNLLLIYGAAGTGKTTLIKLIAQMFKNEKKLFLTKTHTSLHNLKRRLEDMEKADFYTMDKCLKINLNYDIIFIDECSVIDNRTMDKFLSRLNSDTLLVLAGDIYQIESIDFGNWFFYAKDIIKNEYINVELLNTWRTNKEKLVSLWDEVRACKPLITEKLVINGPFSKNIGDEILAKEDEDEVVLCLNYDGKYGLNNMNLYFQNNNQNQAVRWGEWSYKIGDRILFCDTKRFTILYNNLKGTIVDIQKLEDRIVFTIDVDILLLKSECKLDDIEFISATDKTTRIRFSVYEYTNDSDEDRDELRKRSIVPFHLAYAISIHKAQGLEYNSVKIVIPKCNQKNITHGIFYTAITRTKEKLKIFWSPEVMKQVIESFSLTAKRTRSLEIIKSKLNM